MSDTPLSDAITEYLTDRSADAYDRFVSRFRESVAGVVVSGDPVPDEQGNLVSDGTLGVGRTEHGGQSRILTYADPEAFARRYGPRFNAGISGEVLLRMAADDPECAGILVNSATEETSVVISRETAAGVLAPRKTWRDMFRRGDR
ncbi:hypothetical protein [Actinoplanes sp. NPDC026670]|uniref:hypothetical protein n=1 Tax=Actinoplanes sp. NPDC026670 TaxID=3154700 RepID=UPI0033DB2613